jgi:hypothetical protein
MKYTTRKSCFVLLLALANPEFASAVTLEDLDTRIEKLEAENKALKQQRMGTTESATSFLEFNNQFGYSILDPTTNINRKQILILKNRQNGILQPNRVNMQGAVTAIANYQKSNVADKFGYLMQTPTASNHRGKDVSKAGIHSAQLGLTATAGNWVNVNILAFYNPEQSFGSGTNTALDRNLVQIRRAYVLFGNLEWSPLYASIGKMATPFGSTDTVNPFTASTIWHAFGGLANGLTVGYLSNGFNASVMAVQGGAQFRANNTSVDGTAIPSRLNNYVVDVNYTVRWGDSSSLLLGGSYQRGSAYCQEFPIVHFGPCPGNNPAYDFYTKLTAGGFTLKAEYAQTLREWPGTFNPDIPEFAASKVKSWDIGLKYRPPYSYTPVDYSLEFSRFNAGPSGAPWEKQDQVVVGVAGFITPSVKLFGEYIRVEGFAPLNFISGGNLPAGETHSDDSVHTDVVMFGVNAAF